MEIVKKLLRILLSIKDIVKNFYPRSHNGDSIQT